VRVSTDRQADDGESLGTQQRVIEGYAMMQGLKLDVIFVERGVSGSKPLGDRPEGARLLAGLKPGDVVITPKLDRLFRSALNALDVLGQLKQRGVSLHMIDLGGDDDAVAIADDHVGLGQVQLEPADILSRRRVGGALRIAATAWSCENGPSACTHRASARS
jgi:Resolvase, N terminal domain